MSLMRPVIDLQNQFEQQFNRMFNDLVQGFGFPATESVFQPGIGRMGQPRAWMPAVEVSETPDAYCVRAEIPGVSPDELDVEVADNIVTLSGETRHEIQREEGENIHRSELRYGRFLRRIPLPGHVNSEQAQASFSNGLLELNLPKAEEQRRRRIKVESTGNGQAKQIQAGQQAQAQRTAGNGGQNR